MSKVSNSSRSSKQPLAKKSEVTCSSSVIWNPSQKSLEGTKQIKLKGINIGFLNRAANANGRTEQPNFYSSSEKEKCN